MKKITALFAALALVLLFCLPAMAASDGIGFSSAEEFNLYQGEGEQSIDEVPDVFGENTDEIFGSSPSTEEPSSEEKVTQKPVDEKDIAAVTDYSVENYVVDEADVLTDDEENRLAKYFAAITEARECAVIAVTKDGIDDDIEAYTDDFYDYGGYGYGSDHTGVMMLLDMSEREWWITTTGGDVIYTLQPFIDEMGDAFIAGLDGSDDFYSGFFSFGSFVDGALCGLYDGEEGYDYGDDAEPPYPSDGEWSRADNGIAFGLSLPAFIGVSLIVGLVLALLTVRAMKGKNKSVRFAAGAESYQKNGTFVLNRQNERFLYHTVTRTKIATESNNSGHSGGGGGIHVGSSGTSHGGGGGHF